MKNELLIDSKGFTLPEVAVTLSVSALFVGLILFFGISYSRYGYTLAADADTLVTRLNTQDFLREQIGGSSGLVMQNSLADNAALNPDPSINGSQFWEVQHAIPKTYTPSGSGTTPVLYYKRFSVTSNNTFIMNGAQPYEDEFILYIDNAKKKLLVRTLANPNAVNNKAKTSCAPASATPTCPADKVIATDIESITTRFFSRSGNTIDWTSVYDTNTNSYAGPDYPVVEVMEFNIKLAQRAAMEKTNTTRNTTVVRIALRNT